MIYYPSYNPGRRTAHMATKDILKKQVLLGYPQSSAKDWRILIVLKTLKMRQSLAFQFLAAISRNFWLKNWHLYFFWDILKRFYAKLGNETVIFGQNQEYVVSIEYQS